MLSSTDEFGIVRQQVSLRFSEVRTFWSGTKAHRVPAPAQQSFAYLAGSGFTIVFLYAALEFAVTRSVKQLSQLITSYSVRTKDVCNPIMCLVHDPKINTLMSAGKKTRLGAGLGLFSAIQSRETARIHDELLTPELQNIWFKSIVDMFLVFGITGYHLSEVTSAPLIDRIVNDRNEVAHGRESPDAVGSLYSQGDIDNLIGRIETEAQFIINKLAEFYVAREFIHESDRTRYLKREQKAAALAGATT